MYEKTMIEQEVFKAIEQRQKVGRETYGQGIDLPQNDVHGWINEAIEEAADLLTYLVAVKCKLNAMDAIADSGVSGHEESE